MNVHELAPGLSYWMAAHPAWEATENWPEEVLCVYFEASDGIVLIDPLLPRGHEAEFWRKLDGSVERNGQDVRVLLTSPWHARDTPAHLLGDGSIRRRAGRRAVDCAVVSATRAARAGRAWHRLLRGCRGRAASGEHQQCS